MMDGVRQRQHLSRRSLEENFYSAKHIPKKLYPLPNGTQHLLFVLTFFLSISLIVIVLEKILPEPKLVDSEGLFPDRFIAERSRAHVVNLTSVGPRVAGSYENEVLAIRYLTAAINGIIRDANENHKIVLDIAKHSGAFPLKFLDGFTNVYQNVQNVIVKLGPQRPSKHSLLLNCHFDTFIQSPGGSDDAAGCAVMLEVLRVMSLSPKLLKNNIIFLFNGAEENILEASHGFITQHPWAKEVRAFINLEACGAGGRELLFQAGPGNPWILEVYSQTVPYPYASSLAQEIFQSGIVPGDTDFRIFRDFGKVSGLDFAWSTNGYVYHTRFDTVNQIPLGSLQRTGDNILALSRGIALSPYLPDSDSQRSDGSLVFFDFLGAFVIRWPLYVATIVNVLGILIGIYSIFINMEYSRKEVKSSMYVRQLMMCVATVICSWLISMISASMIALLLTKLGKVMSWYARPAWLFFLYVCPTATVSMTFLLSMGKRQRRDIASPWVLYHLYCDAYSIIWMSVLFLCIILEIRSGFIPLHWVIFPAIGNAIRYNFLDKWRGWKWLCFKMGILCIPYVQTFYLTLGALYLFVPIMGRAGAGINSEVVIANMVSLTFCLLLSFVIPIVLLIRNAERVLSVLIGIFLLSIGILILTPLGFPYSGDPVSPAAQRFMIMHTQRQYYNANGTLRYSGAGYWLVDLDMSSPHSVEAFVPEVGAATPTIKDCKEELYCGLPYLLPVTTFLWKTSWIPGPAPLITIPTKLDLLEKMTKRNALTYTFNVTGPDHISMTFSPYKGIKLQSWSVLKEKPLLGPKWNERDTYFVYFACASNCSPFTFSVEFIVPPEHKGPCMTISLSGHFMHGEHQTSARFKRFLSQFPSWTVVTPWTASLTLWEY